MPCQLTERDVREIVGRCLGNVSTGITTTTPWSALGVDTQYLRAIYACVVREIRRRGCDVTASFEEFAGDTSKTIGQSIRVIFNSLRGRAQRRPQEFASSFADTESVIDADIMEDDIPPGARSTAYWYGYTDGVADTVRRLTSPVLPMESLSQTLPQATGDILGESIVPSESEAPDGRGDDGSDTRSAPFGEVPGPSAMTPGQEAGENAAGSDVAGGAHQ